MEIICAWCKKFLGTKLPLQDRSISHGMCPECKKKMLAQAEESRNKKNNHIQLELFASEFDRKE